MRRRRDVRRRRIVLVAALVVALFAQADGGALRRNAASLGGEWWDCLVHQEPPTKYEETVNAYREEVRRKRRLTGRSGGVGSLPVTTPRASLERARSRHVLGDAGLPQVTVAIIDSGIDGWHEDLHTSEVLPGLDALNPCGDGRTDISGHGTAVAGVIASASRGAAIGVRLLPVRTSLGTGQGLRPLNAAAIVWATHNGADVINMSRASLSSRASPLEHAAVRYAVDRGVTIVASAGNHPDKPVAYPAAYPEVIAVTSVNGRGQLSAFAARGREVDLAAPGSRVETLAVNNAYGIETGTSFAAPLVTAAVARLEAIKPALSPAEVQRLLRETASPLLFAERQGAGYPFGVLDINALARAAGARRITPTPSLESLVDGSPGPSPSPVDPRPPGDANDSPSPEPDEVLDGSGVVLDQILEAADG